MLVSIAYRDTSKLTPMIQSIVSVPSGSTWKDAGLAFVKKNPDIYLSATWFETMPDSWDDAVELFEINCIELILTPIDGFLHELIDDYSVTNISVFLTKTPMYCTQNDCVVRPILELSGKSICIRMSCGVLAFVDETMYPDERWRGKMQPYKYGGRFKHARHAIECFNKWSKEFLIEVPNNEV